jgi:hypothetical protein
VTSAIQRPWLSICFRPVFTTRCLLLSVVLFAGSALRAEETATSAPQPSSPPQQTQEAAPPSSPQQAQQAAPPPPASPQPTESETVFLDRLMMAESGGRENARNPRSTALGPFQFLASTFLDVMGRYFAAAMEGKNDAEILQLRSDMKVSRDAALAYTRENAAFLVERGHEASAAHLRLAFLVGPSGAARVIAAEPTTPVAQLLGASALDANPFMNAMTAKDLLERAANEAAGLQLVTVPTGRVKRTGVMGIRIRCNLGRASCRRWVALASKREARRTARQAKADAGKNGETKKD